MERNDSQQRHSGEPLGIYDFLRQEIEGRGKLIYALGTFLLDYEADDLTFYLYDMNGFYAEVTMESFSGRVINISGFTKGIRLDNFLNQIELVVFS